MPILQGGANAGAVTIQFREFGIRLSFTADDHREQHHQDAPARRKSRLSIPADGVTLNGFTIPALSTRARRNRCRTGRRAELRGGRPGRTTRKPTAFSKIPILGSLPIFGALFKTKDEKKQRTDLVVMVTPEITEPLGRQRSEAEHLHAEGFPGAPGSERRSAAAKKSAEEELDRGRDSERPA